MWDCVSQVSAVELHAANLKSQISAVELHATNLKSQISDLKSGLADRRFASRWAVSLTCFLLLAAATQTLAQQPATAPVSVAADPARDTAFISTLEQANRHHAAGAFHLEAESLENALALLPPGHLKRVDLANRLAAVYRGGLWRFERALFWLRTIADELGPQPEGINPLFELADTLFNHGKPDEALAIYRGILKRIMAPDPPWDRNDDRCSRGWRGEELCKFPMGCDPLFPSDLSVAGKLGRLPQLVQNRDWRAIRSALDQNLPLQSLIQQSDGSVTWSSLRRWVGETLSGLPPEAAQALVSAYEPALKDLAENNDWRALAAFRLSHPIPQLEPRVDIMIGDELLDLGLPALASLYFGRAVRHADTTAPESLAREVFSRVQAGEFVSPESVPDIVVEAGEAKQSLRQHLASWQPSSPGTSAAEPAQLELAASVVTRLPVARATLPLREWQFRWEARAVVESDVPPFAEEFVPLIPVGTSQCLVLNMGDAVQAVDIADDRLLWTFLPPEHNAMTFPAQKYVPQKTFLECARARTAAVVGDRVYCHLAWGHHDTYRHTGAVFALDRSDGQMLWSSLYLPELADIMIAGDPAVSRGVVVALAWRPREALPLFFVVGLSAETGELLWLNHLYSGGSLTAHENQFFFDHPLANATPVIADGVAYLCTGAGVVAAVDIMDGTTRWATSYPRLKTTNSAQWASHMTTSRPAGIIAVFENTVLFAPVDAHVLLAVDRSTGKTKYRRELLDLKAVAAADAERAYLVEGTTVRAIKPADGQTIWERSLSTTGLVGLPTLGPRGLMCPTWEALYVFDPVTGAVREQKNWSREDACSHLCDLGDRLVGATQTGLNVLAGQKLDDIDPAWLAPEADVKPVKVEVPSRADKWVRWGLPAVDRGDFVLSKDDPDHILIRSELLQLRDMEPVPTLRWQRQSPLPWECEAAFNRHWVAVWNLNDVYVLDAKTGRTVWKDHLNQRINRPIARVRIVERQVQVNLGWQGGKVPPQPAPAFILFDGENAKEVLRDDPSILMAKTAPRDGVDQGVTYAFEGRRVRAFNRDRRQLWQTLTLLDEPRLITRMGKYVVALTQDRTFRQGHLRDVSYLRVFDAGDGQTVKSIAFPKRWFHRVGESDGRLLLWDCAFLYCIAAPQAVPADQATVVIRQDRPDPDAIAALRMARDLEDVPVFEIPTLPSAPRVDAGLSEWTGVKPCRLSGVMDWTPDFVRRGSTAIRSYAGSEGCAADVRMAFFGEDFYVAVEVSDDKHWASPAPGLWRSDSVSLIFGEPKGEEIDPLILTVALVNGVPRFELGTAVSALAVSDPAGQELVSSPGPRRFLLPSLSAGAITLPKPTQSLEIAARRDEATRRTYYEFRVPRLLFRYGPDFYWDLIVNENDGAGRAGALQMASATWGTEETQIGSLRGVRGQAPGRVAPPSR